MRDLGVWKRSFDNLAERVDEGWANFMVGPEGVDCDHTAFALLCKKKREKYDED